MTFRMQIDPDTYWWLDQEAKEYGSTIGMVANNLLNGFLPVAESLSYPVKHRPYQVYVSISAPNTPKFEQLASLYNLPNSAAASELLRAAIKRQEEKLNDA